MIRTIFSDLDGVIRHWDNRRLFELETQFGLSKGYVFQCAFQPERLISAITGAVSHELWCRTVEQQLNVQTDASIAKALLEAWLASPFHLDLELIDGFKQRFPQADLVLVTNATTDLPRSLESTGLTELVDEVVNSSDIGVAKPDPAFYKVALERTQSSAAQALYIDDSLQNCEAARALGICAIHFRDRDTALHELNHLAQNHR
jgi:putative hydrolase of the HAD superfamily